MTILVKPVTTFLPGINFTIGLEIVFWIIMFLEVVNRAPLKK
jgi:hypothetical protein